MLLAHYTPKTICQCIGLAGFETDPDIALTGEAIRLLLQPSFHPEICITVKNGPQDALVSVVAAQAMVWHQLAPAPILADQDQGQVSMECFTRLSTAVAAAGSSLDGTGVAIDGMPVDALLMRNGELILKIHHNASTSSAFKTFVAHAISAAWSSLQSAPCRNSLAHAAKYAGLDLPLDPEPARKPTVETMVLGSEEDRQELLNALKQHHRH